MNRREVECFILAGVLLDPTWLATLRGAGVRGDGFEDQMLASIWHAMIRCADADDVEPTIEVLVHMVVPEHASEAEEIRWRELLMWLDESPPAAGVPLKWARAFVRHAGKAKAGGWLA